MSGDRANKRDVDAAHAPTRPADAHDTAATAPADAVAAPTMERASLPPVLATRYELKRVIGVGGMGLVYEALDLNLHRLVALKVLKLAPTKPEERADAVNRLVREARAMAALSHKNVVTVHDVGYHEDQVFVAMQLVEGTTMRQWLQARKRRRHDILTVLYEAGSGLAAAHAARLIHRDFKPDNILVSQRGTVRVTDFGLARRSDGLIEPTGVTQDRVSAPGAILEGDNVDVTSVTRSGAIVGTPAYMAPEQAAGTPLDARADQFSFCVTAWEALYGARPFGGKNWSEIYASVQNQVYTLPATNRKVPRALQKALRRGLSVEPAERFPSMVELLDVFEDALREPIRRRRTVAAGLAVLAVVVAVIVSRNVGTDREVAAKPVAEVAAPRDVPAPTTSETLPTRDRSRERMQLALREKKRLDTPPVFAPSEPPPVVDKKPAKKIDPPKQPKLEATRAAPPVPEAPKPDTSALASLRTSHAMIDGELRRRELLDSDVPAFVDAKRAMAEALTANDAGRAAAELDKARAAIANVTIDGPFIDKKVQRASVRIGKLPKDKQAEFAARLNEVLALYTDGQFVVANRKINEIVKLTVSK